MTTNRAFCNCTGIRFPLLTLGCEIPPISPRPNGTSFPTVSPKPRPMADPDNTLTWQSSMGFITSTKHCHPTGIAEKMVGSMRETCHTAGHEKSTSPNLGQAHRFASGLQLHSSLLGAALGPRDWSGREGQNL